MCMRRIVYVDVENIGLNLGFKIDSSYTVFAFTKKTTLIKKAQKLGFTVVSDYSDAKNQADFRIIFSMATLMERVSDVKSTQFMICSHDKSLVSFFNHAVHMRGYKVIPWSTVRHK